MSKYTKLVKLTISSLTLCASLNCIQAEAIGNQDLNNEKKNLAVGAKIGILGIGIEARTPMPNTDKLYVRLGVNYFGMNNNKLALKGAIKYKIKASLLNIPLMLDYHPIDNSGFRISAGVAYNNYTITGKATPNKNVTLYGRTYTPADLGSLKAKVKLGNKAAPILSIGYDSSLLNDNRYSFNAELGVMYLGKPSVKVSTSSAIDKALIVAALRGDPAAKAIYEKHTTKLSAIERDAKAQLKKKEKFLKFIPILSVGFKVNF